METILSQKTFTKTWWEAFVEKNKNFTQTCVFKNVLDESTLRKLEQGTMEALLNKFKLKAMTFESGFRFYQDGEMKSPKEVMHYCEKLPEDQEDITSYAKRVFGENFGLIMNVSEKLSKTLASTLGELIQPIFDVAGIPARGLEINLFIGDYQWTPLGIHQDFIGENVIHFHLGPGRKVMYVWEEEIYKNLPNAVQGNMNVEDYRSHATAYDFGRGDLYYMPWDNYHIGSSDGLSVGLLVSFNNPTLHNFLGTIIDTFPRLYFDDEKRTQIIQPSKDYLNDDQALDAILDGLTLPEGVLEMKGEDFLHYFYNDYRNGIMSNGGWQSPPLPREQEEGYNPDDYEDLLPETIQSENTFPICYYKQNEELILFVRGKRMAVRYHESLEDIITQINTNMPLQVKTLLQDLSKTWPLEVGLYFLAQIYNNQGFEIV